MIPSKDARWKASATVTPQAMAQALQDTHEKVGETAARLSTTVSLLKDHGDAELFEDPSKAKHVAEKAHHLVGMLRELLGEVQALSRNVKEPERDAEVTDHPDNAER